MDQRSNNLLPWVCVRRPSSSVVVVRRRRPSSVTERISEVFRRIFPKFELKVTWPNTPGRFFPIFEFGDFGDLAAIFGRFRPFFNFGNFFLKNCSVTFSVFLFLGPN